MVLLCGMAAKHLECRLKTNKKDKSDKQKAAVCLHVAGTRPQKGVNLGNTKASIEAGGTE